MTTRAARLTDYLVRKRQLDPGIVAEILDRFVEVGIVDDARFARNWAQERARTRRLSRRAISRELSVRGVSEEPHRDRPGPDLARR